MDTSRQTKNLNKLLIRILLHLQVEFSLYYLIQTKKKDLIRNACGSTFLEISANEIRKIKVAVPVQNEQEQIAKLLSLVDERIATQNKIIEKYESLINGINCKIFASIQGSEYRLGDIATITNGNSNVQDASTEYRIGFYPFFDRSEEIKYLPTFLFDKESIIYPGEGTEFTPRYFNGKFAVHQRCYAIFDFKEVVNPKFVYFFLKTQNSYFIRNAVGSTVPSLRLDTFQKLKVVIPLPEIQHSVSSFLSVLEQKLDVENNVIKKFLWQKQYLLRQMFI
ncbi:MAG: restriction endonuclease subunit S [Bacteroidales bacterium]